MSSASPSAILKASSRRPRPLEAASLLKALAVIAVVACITIHLKCNLERLRIPFEIDYEEGNILNTGLRIAQGQTPYPTPGTFPYILNPYGPIGYVLSSVGIKLFGLSLFGPRLLVLIAGLGIAGLITVLVRRSGGRLDAGFLLAFSFLCLPAVFYWLPLLRVDLWAILLSLLGLYVFLAFPVGWPFAGLIFGLAILTKQTALAAPAAVFLELLLRKKAWKAFGLAGIAAFTLIACAVLLGRGFVFSFLKTHPDAYSFRHAIQLAFNAAHSCILVLAIAAYALIFGFRWTLQSRLMWVYALFCTLTALSAGKLGSNSNHLLEWMAAICIFSAIALSHLLENKNELAKPFVVSLIMLAVVLTVMSQRNFGYVRVDQQGCSDAYVFVQSFPGDRILSDDIASLVLGGKEVLVSNPFVLTQLGNSVNWQAGTVDELADRKYFNLIVLGGTVESFIPSAGGDSPALMASIAKHYTPYRYFQCDYSRVAYVPR